MFESLTRFIHQFEGKSDFGERPADCGHAGTPDDPIRLPSMEYSQMVRELEDSFLSFVGDYPELCLTRYGEILEAAGLE